MIVHTVMVSTSIPVPVAITLSITAIPIALIVPSLVAVRVTIALSVPVSLSFAFAFSVAIPVNITGRLLAFPAGGGCAIFRRGFPKALFLPLRKLGKGSATTFFVLDSFVFCQMLNEGYDLGTFELLGLTRAICI